MGSVYNSESPIRLVRGPSMRWAHVLTLVALFWLSTSVASAYSFHKATFLVHVEWQAGSCRVYDHSLPSFPSLFRLDQYLINDVRDASSGSISQSFRDVTFSDIPLPVPGVPASEEGFGFRHTAVSHSRFFRDAGACDDDPDHCTVGWVHEASVVC